MFKNLLSFWKGKDFLSDVFSDFKGMLDDSEVMFRAVCGRLLGNTDEPDLKQTIYDIDKKVNRLQKHIRKRIVEHLSLQPTVDDGAITQAELDGIVQAVTDNAGQQVNLVDFIPASWLPMCMTKDQAIAGGWIEQGII